MLTTLSKGDTYKSSTIDSVADLKFNYKIYNLSCLSSTPVYPAKGTMLLAPNDAVPNIAGYQDQASIKEMLEDLDSYEELYLAELGTSDKNSSAYDLQDVVLVVNNNPTLSTGDPNPTDEPGGGYLPD